MPKQKTEYKKMAGVQNREKLGYAHPTRVPNWDMARYPSRTGFGMNLDDFYYKNEKEYKYTYKGQLYTITREKAVKVAVRINIIPSLPHLVPIEAWTVSEITKPLVEWEIDPVTNLAYVKGSRKPKEEPKQGSLL